MSEHTEMMEAPGEQAAGGNATSIAPQSGGAGSGYERVRVAAAPGPSCMRSAESRRVFRISRRKRNSRRRPGARTRPARPTDRRFTPFSPSARTATSCGNCAGCLSIQGLDTYLLQPRDPADFDVLVEAIRPAPSPNDIDVVIGVRGPVAPPELCNGLMVPIVAIRADLLLRPRRTHQGDSQAEKNRRSPVRPAAEELFTRIMQLTDNAGATDEHRALNYLTMRYPAIYATAAEEFAKDFSLTGVDVRRSALSSTRSIVDVIFAYTNRNTDFTEKFFVRCDLTEQFPFLVTKMSPYYDR